MYGFTDIAKDKDDLEITDSILGFMKYISNCNTPMTISLQGEWGSGKTTLMNIVMRKLLYKNNVKVLFLNMWQYSQFSCQDDLPIIMIQEFARAIAPKKKERIKKAPEAVKSMAMTGVDSIVGSRMGEHAGKAIDELYKILGVDIENKSSPVYLKNLKSELQKAIDKCLESEGKERIVVFIDDLDRINSVSALHLLECLKNYMDCEHCVFVIALDYNAVIEGAKSKYGLSDAKSKQYFDKIIQVNYQLPISQYNINNMINEGIDMLSEEHSVSLGPYKDIYSKMVMLASGKNPRAIKKLFNTTSLFYLTNKRENDDPYSNALISALVCVQVFYYYLYKDIERNLLYDRLNTVRQILNVYDRLGKESSESDLKKVADTVRIPVEHVDSFIEFCHVFIAVLQNGFSIDDEKLRFLKNIVTRTSMVDSRIHDTNNRVFSFDIMGKVSFCEGYDIDLNKFSFIDQWEKNKNDIGIPVSVGIDTIGNEVVLDITRIRNGPHILVGGRTGSGKTEFLRTYLLGLALNYSYERVKFITIDFKGGGAFREFAKLPHMEEMISNENELLRCIENLKRDVEFRLQLLQVNRVSNISELRIMDITTDISSMSEKIIVIDEISPIKREQPDLFQELLSIGMVGSTIGYHILFSTQNAAGTVDDRLWSMCNSFIVFKTSKLDSMDLIHSERASELSRPGEAIMASWNENKVFQVYYSEKDAECIIESIVNTIRDEKVKEKK